MQHRFSQLTWLLSTLEEPLRPPDAGTKHHTVAPSTGARSRAHWRSASARDDGSPSDDRAPVRSIWKRLLGRRPSSSSASIRARSPYGAISSPGRLCSRVRAVLSGWWSRAGPRRATMNGEYDRPCERVRGLRRSDAASKDRTDRARLHAPMISLRQPMSYINYRRHREMASRGPERRRLRIMTPLGTPRAAHRRSRWYQPRHEQECRYGGLCRRQAGDS